MCFDENPESQKQIVIKQMGVRKGRWRPEIPMEVKMMRKMVETDCPSAVRHIAYRRYLHDQVHRIYMEYCPHGDLRKLEWSRDCAPRHKAWKLFDSLLLS